MVCFLYACVYFLSVIKSIVSEKRYPMKRKLQYKRVMILVLILVLAVLCGLGIWWFLHKDNELLDSMQIEFYSETADIEYGAEFDAKQLIKTQKGELKEVPTIDTKTLGKQEIVFVLTKDGEEKKIPYTINIKDNQAPVIVLKQETVTLNVGDQFQIDEVITSVSDIVDGKLTKSEGEAKGSYWISGEVDTSQAGSFQVIVKAMDKHDNKAEKTIKVNVSTQAQSNTNEIEPTYINGILLVNKTHGLPRDFGETDPTAYAALQQLQADANKVGYEIPLMSGYRSYDYQVQLYNNYVAAEGQEAADTYSARPGFSEHQTGLTFDIGQMEYDYGDTPEGTWLHTHAHEYGFIIRYPEGKEDITGYRYEPWHVRYVGVDVASEIYKRGITLEEYLNVY